MDDLPLPNRAVAVYAPGLDITAAAEFVREIGPAPWSHFGDLDPAGLDIAQQLEKKVNRTVTLYVPSFAHEYLDAATPVKSQWSDQGVGVEVIDRLRNSERSEREAVYLCWFDNRHLTDYSAP